MKHLINFLILSIFFALSCKNNPPTQTNDEVHDDYENQFFSLDFENDKLSMDDLDMYFFTDFPHGDPTRGEVVYDQSRWQRIDLFEVKEKDGFYAYVRARDDSLAFDSYRMTSKAYYNLKNDDDKILFVYKGSMPSSEGLWPAWWLNGSREKPWLYQDSKPSLNNEMLTKYSGIGEPWNTQSVVNNTDWPGAGEIDIIENINGEKEIHNTLHTCPQMCDSEWNQDGILINCANSRTDDVNPGCSGQNYQIDELSGTFACLWEKDFISFYYWPPGMETNNVDGPLSTSPKPKSWMGEELKNRVRLLETKEVCEAEKHQDWQCKNCAESDHCEFSNMKMIFNVTICGIWAGSHFDESENAWDNCRDYILGEGRAEIDGQFMEIEYVAVQKIE